MFRPTNPFPRSLFTSQPTIMLWLVSLSFLQMDTGCSQHTASFSSPSNISFEPIPYSQPDLNAPSRGAEQWHDQNKVDIPVAGSNTQRLDKYYRFNWSQLETEQNVYDWTAFDTEINDAIDKRQKFSFGIMPTNLLAEMNTPGAVNMQGKASVYPLYLHDQMQSETVKDWISPMADKWVPNWNSNYYLTALENLNAAINQHLDTGSYKGIDYKNVIGYIDIRGYGSYGEWHEAYLVDKMSEHPEGTRASIATLNRIIDAHVNKFPNYQLVALMSVFDGNMLNNTKIPPEVGYHALTVKNAVGPLGWRRDNWGAMDNYLSRYLEGNPTVHKGLSFKNTILERWKTAPVLGEPNHGGSSYNGCDYGDLENQIRRYHASSFGNGNYADVRQPCMQENIRAASKAAGYRLVLESGYIDSSVRTGDSLHILLNWKNTGIAPSYENWVVVYELRSSINDSLAWSANSVFNPRLFLPQENASLVTDKFILPGTIPPGNYHINLLIKDPNNYRQPLPLAIQGRHSDGSYTLRTIIVSKK